MRISLLLLLLLFPLPTPAQETMPLAKLVGKVSVTYDPQDLQWLQYGGTIGVSVVVDPDGKAKIIDVVGPVAPCSGLTDSRLASLRRAVTDALEKGVYEPGLDAAGKPVKSGMKFNIRVPSQQTGAVLELLPAMRQGGALGPTKGTLLEKVKEMAKPDYPDSARNARASGYVDVQVLVDELGSVLSAGALNGHPDLRLPAARAACRSKFVPTLQNGTPVKVSGVLNYAFVLP